MKEEDLYDRIISFVMKETMVRNVDFNSSTQMEKDLGVTGDDAAELIEAFGKEFQVDVSNFIIHDYFGPEGVDFFGQFVDIKCRKKLTIADLFEAVKQGKLV